MRRTGSSFAALVLVVLVELSAPEFVELQKLSAEALRARFQLPSACEPVVTAVSTVSTSRRLLVLIDCARGEVSPSHLPGP